jgi:hypothetical protein
MYQNQIYSLVDHIIYVSYDNEYFLLIFYCPYLINKHCVDIFYMTQRVHIKAGGSKIRQHLEVNHHVPSAVDCGASMGPHGRPPILGMFSTKLVRVPDCGSPRWVPRCNVVHPRMEMAPFCQSLDPCGVRYISYGKKITKHGLHS